jgi:hypothetical protein
VVLLVYVCARVGSKIWQFILAIHQGAVGFGPGNLEELTKDVEPVSSKAMEKSKKKKRVEIFLVFIGNRLWNSAF